MQFELSEIGVIRKKLGLTQKELAIKSGVSQSLIAKIENGLIDPSYSSVRKIFDSLINLNNKKELKAKDIMVGRIISIAPEKKVKEAIQLMRRNDISQMPVIKDNKVVGLITEEDVIKNIEGLGKDVEEIMGEGPPLVSINSCVHVISSLLRYYPIVLVSEKGELKGVISKIDLLRKLS